MSERQPTDKVKVAVYDTTTGEIKQTTRCSFIDMASQHLAHDGHDFLEVTNPAINPHDYVVDLATKSFVARVTPTAGDLSLKETELRAAARVESFQSGARTYQMNDDSFRSLMIATVVGGDVMVEGTLVTHTPADAKKVLGDYMTLKNSNDAQFMALLKQASGVKNRDQLKTIKLEKK